MKPRESATPAHPDTTQPARQVAVAVLASVGRIEPEVVSVHLKTREFADREIAAAVRKSDLAQLVFHRQFVFTAELIG